MNLFKRISYKEKIICIYNSKMIFRNAIGELIEINKYNFINDKLYYEKIMELKMEIMEAKKEFTKSDKTFDNKNSKQS